MNNDKKVHLPILLFGIFIIGIFMCNHRFLGITEYYYFPIIILSIFLFKIKKKFKLNYEHYLIIYFLIFLVLNLIRYQVAFNSGVFISYFLFALLFLIISLQKINKEDLRYLISCYIISSIIISLMIIIFRKELDGWQGTYRYTIKFINQVYIDPNFVGAFINIGAIFSFNRLLNTKDKLLYAIVTLIIMVAVFLTGSRGAMLGMFLGIGIMFVNKTSIKKIILFITLSTIIFALIYIFLPQEILDRFFKNSYLDGSNLHRLKNWHMGILAFLKKPIIGYGLIDSGSILGRYLGYNSAIHNTYITWIVQLGILGFFPLFGICLNAIIKSIKLKSNVLKGVLISMFFTSIMIEQNLSLTFWIIIIISYLIINYEKRHNFINVDEIL